MKAWYYYWVSRQSNLLMFRSLLGVRAQNISSCYIGYHESMVDNSTMTRNTGKGVPPPGRSLNMDPASRQTGSWHTLGTRTIYERSLDRPQIEVQSQGDHQIEFHRISFARSPGRFLASQISTWSGQYRLVDLLLLHVDPFAKRYLIMMAFSNPAASLLEN